VQIQLVSVRLPGTNGRNNYNDAARRPLQDSMSSLDQLIHFAHEAFSKSGGIPPLHHDAFEAVRCAAGM
jgi:hypothetical protein